MATIPVGDKSIQIWPIQKKEYLLACPPDRSTTANFPSEMAFNPLFHHLSLSERVLSSTVETQDSGTGSMPGCGGPLLNEKDPEVKRIVSDSNINDNQVYWCFCKVYLEIQENIELYGQPLEDLSPENKQIVMINRIYFLYSLGSGQNEIQLLSLFEIT